MGLIIFARWRSAKNDSSETNILLDNYLSFPKPFRRGRGVLLLPRDFQAAAALERNHEFRRIARRGVEPERRAARLAYVATRLENPQSKRAAQLFLLLWLADKRRPSGSDLA